MLRPRTQLRRYSVASAFGFWLATAGGLVWADGVRLKDGASLTGRILTEKADQVVVDMGYTVLQVPRNQIEKITRADNPAAPAPQASPPPSVRRNLFYAATVPPPERTVREQVAQLGEAVVQVRTPSALGSGFIINEEGYLVTNFHVIEGETQISVEVYHLQGGQLERKSYRQVLIVAMNKFADLVLLKIDDPGAPKFPYVWLGDADALAAGERVFAIGSPLGLARTVTEGIVSTKTRERQGALYLQTTTQINPGNSGGPLFNLRGEVVGVTNMKAAYGEGLGFAIPVEQVKYFLNHQDSYAYDNSNPNNAYRYLEPPHRARPSTADHSSR
jgi:serine protease Do